MDGKSWLDGAYMDLKVKKDGIPIAESSWMKERDAEKFFNRDNEIEVEQLFSSQLFMNLTAMTLFDRG